MSTLATTRTWLPPLRRLRQRARHHELKLLDAQAFVGDHWSRLRARASATGGTSSARALTGPGTRVGASSQSFKVSSSTPMALDKPRSAGVRGPGHAAEDARPEPVVGGGAGLCRERGAGVGAEEGKDLAGEPGGFTDGDGGAGGRHGARRSVHRIARIPRISA